MRCAFLLPTAAFDYALTNMFLHHLDDEQVVTVFRDMLRVARRGVVVADLSPRGVGLSMDQPLHASGQSRWFATMCGSASDRRSPTPRSCASRIRAGMMFASYYSHFGYRWVLAGERTERNPAKSQG